MRLNARYWICPFIALIVGSVSSQEIASPFDEDGDPFTPEENGLAPIELIDDPHALEEVDDPFADKYKYWDRPALVRVQLRLIELPSVEAREVLSKGNEGHESIYSLAKQLENEGKARLVNEVVLAVERGKRSNIGSYREYTYPTEWDPDTYRFSHKTPNPILWEKTWLRPKTFTAFETRNVGEETTISLGDVSPKSVSLWIDCEHTKHVRNLVWATFKDRWGGYDEAHPHFQTYWLRTTLTIRPGVFQLAAAHTPQTKEGELDTNKTVLTFVKVTPIEP